MASSEENRRANIETMGQDLGELFSELWQDVARLFGKWEEYVELFGTKGSRIRLMNEAASDFFGKLQISGFENVLLDIACLTDPPRMGKRETLSIGALADLIEDDALKARVADLFSEALKSAAFARDWRNRHLAHRDKALALGKAKPLEDATRENVWLALRALAAVLNEVDYHYKQSSTKFDSGISVYGGALALLYVIDDGVRAEKERRARLESGEPLPSDYTREV